MEKGCLSFKLKDKNRVQTKEMACSKALGWEEAGCMHEKKEDVG